MDLDGVFEDGEAELMRDLEGSTAEDVTMRTRLLENEIRVLRDESNRLALDLQSDKERVKENMEKIKMNKQLPYLVGNVVEILDLKPEVRRFGSRQKVPRSSARGQAPLDASSDLATRLKRADLVHHPTLMPLTHKLARSNRTFPLHHERRRRRRRRMAATSTSTRGDRAKPWCSRPPPGRPSFCPSSAWSTEVRFWCTLFIFSSSLLLASARREAPRRFLRQTISDAHALCSLYTFFSRRVEARGPGGREQGLVPHPRHAPRRVRLAGQGDGG
jgi:hypothetical protein